MEPLALLRKHASEKRPVQDDGETLVFGDLVAPKGALTNFKCHTGGHYTIGCLWFLWKNIDLEHGQYILEAKKTPFGSVTRIDRKDVVAYITGDVSTTPKLDATFFVEPASRVDAGEPSQKRVRVEEPTKTTVPAADGQTSVPVLAAETDKAMDVDRAPQRSSDFIREVLARELIYHDRKSILRNTNKSLERVLTMLQTSRKTQVKANGTAPPLPVPTQEPKKPQRSYDRYDQPGLAKREGDEFGINEAGTFMQSDYTPGMLLTSVTEEGSQTQKVPEEKPQTSREKKISKTPIVIVPAGLNCMLTLHNIKKFLEEGNYVSQEEAKQAGAKTQNVAVYKKRPDGTAPYKVVDNVNFMTESDWNRVVAIFCAGPEWQFKGWPWYQQGGIVSVFSKAKGFYVTYDDQRLPAGLEKWDVCVLQLSRTKRHLDSTASRKFWEVLDRYTKKSRSNLRC